MKISKAARAIEPSLSRKLFNMAKNYNDVIDLTLGDPDIAPSKIIKDAACESIQQGKIRYSANAGLQDLRNSIADNFEKEYSLKIDSTKNVAITVGGMEALFLSMACTIDDGDEVIILAPYYVNYKQMITICGGVPVVVNTLEANDFKPSVSDIEAAITEKTVAIIVNTPCNPTGAVIDHDTLVGIADLAKKHDIMVISDEVYRTLVYDDLKHESIVKIPGMIDRTVVVDSLSKRFAMTGYRLGYAIAPEELITIMVKMQENVAACAPVSSQYAGIVAFDKCADDTAIKDEFEVRRNYLCDVINTIEGLSCKKPPATFYVFVNISKTKLDGLTFAYKLLEEAHVAVVPGVTYGEKYENYIRIAYTMEVKKLKVAVERIRAFMETLMK